MSGPGAANSPLSLGELIDLELQLQADRDADVAGLSKRDEAIGQRIGSMPRGPGMLRAWMEQLHRPGGSAGKRIEHAMEIIGVLLAVAGLLTGGSLVWGWLAAESGRPVNVLHFWTVVVGLQLLLLIAVGIAMLPQRWLAWVPGFTTLRSMVAMIESLLPGIAAWIAARISPAVRQTLESDLAAVRRLDRLYGRLKLLIAGRLMQIFAIAFNIGAIVAFIVVGHVTDAALGWRSTLLDGSQVETVARIIALPWRWLLESGVPTTAEIAATHYSALEQRYVAPGGNATGGNVWAAWFPFVLASLVTYGLLARSVLLALLSWRYRRFIAALPLDHVDIVRLYDRLTPLHDAMPPEAATADAAHRPAPVATASSESAWLLRWAGAKIDAASAQASTGTMDWRGVEDVGGVDPTADQAAVERIAASPHSAAVVLAVPGWEPPVGDHLDLLRSLRQRTGERRLIRVLVYGLNGSVPAPASSADLKMWTRRLDSLADPYLRVETIGGGG